MLQICKDVTFFCRKFAVATQAVVIILNDLLTLNDYGMKRIVVLLLTFLPINMMAQPLEKWLTIGPQEWLIPVDLMELNSDTLTYEQELFRLMVPENASFAGIFTYLNECSIAYDSVAHQLVSSEVIHDGHLG